MMIREPVVAERFYPAEAEPCRQALDRCFAQTESTVLSTTEQVFGGLLPHAGWPCSGAVAAAVFSACGGQPPPETVVLFGAVHRSRGKHPAMFATGRWQSPLGSIEIDSRLAERVLSHTSLILDDPYAHEPEHSIEVQVPFVQRTFPGSKLLPIMVPPIESAVEAGRCVAYTVQSYGYRALMLATSDLTHYGQDYGFTPAGVGDRGLTWAKEVNDRRMVERIVALEADAIVAEATRHRNACGAGAIAAAIAAAQVLGAKRGVLLRHTTSREVLGPRSGDNAVGYAGIVFVGPTQRPAPGSPISRSCNAS